MAYPIERMVKRIEVVVWEVRQERQLDGTWDEVEADPTGEETVCEAVWETMDEVGHWGQTQDQLEEGDKLRGLADELYNHGRKLANAANLQWEVKP